MNWPDIDDITESAWASLAQYRERRDRAIGAQAKIVITSNPTGPNWIKDRFMNEQEQGGVEVQFIQTGIELWSGEFGNDYTNRNQVNWRERMPFWKMIEQMTGARSYFEMGCNAGWNLSAIKRQFPDVAVVGNDINEQAANQAKMAGLNVVNRLDFKEHVSGKFELVFTAGVLIHIEPEHLQEVMQALIDKSLRYVLAIEYAAERETIVEYRGHTEKCWKRPYGQMYTELGLKLVAEGPAGAGFDNCTFWLMEKL